MQQALLYIRFLQLIIHLIYYNYFIFLLYKSSIYIIFVVMLLFNKEDNDNRLQRLDVGYNTLHCFLNNNGDAHFICNASIIKILFHFI